MKNVRIKVTENCGGYFWWPDIYEGRKRLMTIIGNSYHYKGNAIRAAKVMAKRIGIKYDPEIIKRHGC